MLKLKAFSSASALCLCIALSTSLSSADVFACSDVLIEVEAQESELAEATCAAVIGAKALLGSCGINQRSPILVAIVDSAIHPSFGECLATYDFSSGCLEVTHPDRYSDLLLDGDARSQLPQDIVFSAIVTHETAHALLQQTAGEVPMGGAEQEFIANAFEMESIDPEWRDILLEAEPVNPSGAVDLVHPAIYALAPRTFANNAWRLFKRADNGCALVQKIISGEYIFPRY